MMAQNAILVTGGSGQVGSAIARLAMQRGLSVWAPKRAELDLTDAAAMEAAIASRNWSAVVNCAAYTAVDRAEIEPALAHLINAAAPAVLARATARAGIPIVHVSTDYVFDGTKPSPYTESDLVNPLSAYGRTKAEGEDCVRSENPNHAIVRTAWVLSAGGANFLNTMLRLGGEREEIAVVDDQLGCPSNAEDIAAALIDVAANIGSGGGTWHFVNSGEATWHSLAARIFAATRARGLPTPRLKPITTDRYPTPAKRPANSRLATAAIARDFAIRPRHWHEAVDEILTQRLGK